MDNIKNGRVSKIMDFVSKASEKISENLSKEFNLP
jgi:hypothetical protein